MWHWNTYKYGRGTEVLSTCTGDCISAWYPMGKQKIVDLKKQIRVIAKFNKTVKELKCPLQDEKKKQMYNLLWLIADVNCG